MVSARHKYNRTWRLTRTLRTQTPMKHRVFSTMDHLSRVRLCMELFSTVHLSTGRLSSSGLMSSSRVRLSSRGCMTSSRSRISRAHFHITRVYFHSSRARCSSSTGLSRFLCSPALTSLASTSRVRTSISRTSRESVSPSYMMHRWGPKERNIDR